MNKILFWITVIIEWAFAFTYAVTSDAAAFLCTMIFGAAALVVLSNKYKLENVQRDK